MKRMPGSKCLLRPLLVAAVAAMGCHEMSVETTLDVDGSGVRNMKLQVEVEEEDSLMSLSDYRQLMNVTEDRGWSHQKTTRNSERSGEVTEYHTFTRRARADDIAGLSAMSGDIYIIGTHNSPLSDRVYFANTIDVATGMSPRGRTLTYRETFAWSGLVEVLLDYRLERRRPQLRDAYPSLSPRQLDEWLGFFRGTFLCAVDNGIFDTATGDRARRFGRSMERVVRYAMEMVRADDPDADPSIITNTVRSIFVEWDELDETAEEMGLMGVVLAIGLDLTLRVDVPGRIVDTNADRREAGAAPAAGRQKLVWEIHPGDAVTRPIEVYVKSEVATR